MTHLHLGRRARKIFKHLVVRCGAGVPAGIVMLLVLGSAVAMGATGADIPHGGYGALTDACLQCHDIHEASADYVLFRWRTVTDVCASCHFLYLTDPGELVANESNPKLGGYLDRSPGTGYDTEIEPAYDPGYSGREALPVGKGVSIGSPYSAYEVDPTDAGAVSGHQVQRGPGQWNFSDGIDSDANYVPGGTAPLTALDITGLGYDPDAPQTLSALSFNATAGLYCASCHTPHGEFGQLLLKSDGTPATAKLLSGQPNHAPATGIVDNWYVQGGEVFCGGCHDKRLDGGTYHNHPARFCLNCHGNATPDPLEPSAIGDFPHTGTNSNLLVAEPDALCVTCHVSGKLP